MLQRQRAFLSKRLTWTGSSLLTLILLGWNVFHSNSYSQEVITPEERLRTLQIARTQAQTLRQHADAIQTLVFKAYARGLELPHDSVLATAELTHDADSAAAHDTPQARAQPSAEQRLARQHAEVFPSLISSSHLKLGDPTLDDLYIYAKDIPEPICLALAQAVQSDVRAKKLPAVSPTQAAAAWQPATPQSPDGLHLNGSQTPPVEGCIPNLSTSGYVYFRLVLVR